MDQHDQHHFSNQFQACTDADLSFLPAHFTVTDVTDSHIDGHVREEEHLDSLLQSYYRHSMSSFVSWSDDKMKKQRNAGKRRILWKNDMIKHSNIPFSVKNTVVLACSHGQKHKRALIPEKKIGDHQYLRNKRFLVQNTRKVGCPAKLFIKRVTFYDDYKMQDGASRGQKQNAIDILTSSLNKNLTTSQSSAIYVQLPLSCAHKKHNVSLESGFSHRIHPSVKEKIYEYVGLGVTTLPFMKRILTQFVMQDLCALDRVKPLPHDRAYFPRNKTIQNHIHAALVAGRYSNMDQDNLQHKVDQWKELWPESHYFLRKCGEEGHHNENISIPSGPVVFPSEEENDEEEEEDSICVEQKSTFLFAHQDREQQKLLAKYGKMVLLDATYKTTKYALPLFLVVVRTNTKYVPVMEFICETESRSAIAEALHLLKSWNPEWNPDFFMLDYSNEEYQALHSVFPSAKKYLCAFHREQAWCRWSRENKNGLNKNNQQEEFLVLMRAIASSGTEDTYAQAVDNLKSSALYIENDRVKAYVDNYWLSIPERWCPAFMEIGFHVSVTTNNGVEALNNSIKNSYLKLSGSGTLSSMVETLVRDFIPNLLLEYVNSNYANSSQYKQYNAAVPEYLHNKPRDVVKKCLQRYHAAGYCKSSDIKRTSSNSFQVKSEVSGDNWYAVSLGSSTTYPFCQCLYFKSTYLPCKHMFALFIQKEATWEDLSPLYRDSPYLNLDSDCLSKAALERVTGPENQHTPSQLDDDSPTTDNLHMPSGDAEGSDSYEVISSVAGLAAAATVLRERLKVIQDLSYLCTDTATLQKAIESLHEIEKDLNQNIPKENSLPLHQGQTVMRQLPQRKRKKKKRQRGTTKSVPGMPSQTNATNDEHGDTDKPRRSLSLKKRNHEQKESGIPLQQTKKVSFGNDMVYIIPSRYDAVKKSYQESKEQGQERKFDARDCSLMTKIDALFELMTNEWDDLVRKSVKCHGGDLSLEQQRAFAVLELYDGVNQEQDLLDYIRGKAPSLTAKGVPPGAPISLLYMCLNELVVRGLISLPSAADPEVMQSRGVQLMRSLTKAVSSLGSSPVQETVLPKPLCEGGFICNVCDEHFVKRSQLIVHSATHKQGEKQSHKTDRDVFANFGLGKTVKEKPVSSPSPTESDILLLELESTKGVWPKSKSGLRFHVCGEVLDAKDFRTLKHPNWLNDKVINAYLAAVQRDKNKGNIDHVFVMPSYMAVLWDNNRFDHWLYQKVKFTQYKWILLPINVNGNHWVLLAADVPGQRVSILDSLGGTNKQYIDKFKKFMNIRAQVCGELHGTWISADIQSAKQQDGNACGAFVMLNALALTRKINTNKLSHRHALAMRGFAMAKLMQESTLPPAQRTICDMIGCSKPGVNNKWVACDVCGRWSHFKCVHITEAPEGDFVCVICSAQYA